MSDKILGIDVSHWQGKVDWHIVASSVKFAFMKATEGATYTDSCFHSNWQEAGEAEILRGAYHYYRPNLDPINQAEHFIDVVGKDSELPHVLDLEEREGIPPLGKLPADVKRFLGRVEQLTARKPMIYTSPSFWNEHMGGTDWASEYDLWIAHYTNSPEPKVPPAWHQWLFWQYTNKGQGSSFGVESQSVDLDWFNGSLDELYSYAKGQATDLPEQVQVTASSLNVRLGPSTEHVKIGQVKSGEKLDVVAREIDHEGNEWLAVKVWLAAKYHGKQFVKPI
jgi:lysozyme